MSITAIQPIPLDIRKELSDPHIPWGISKRIFNEMKLQDVPVIYKKVQVLPTDPEWNFVCRCFHQDKPKRYGIKKVYCIYESHQQQAFELNLSTIEREAAKFKPTWYQEPFALQRAKTIERWKQLAGVFSPFSTMEADGRKRTWEEVKVLPLWHGSSEEMCESIATSGFAHFGKITFGGSNPDSIDEGFFGRGIYFTNSVRYASDICSKGLVFLAWVSMREPFPIVGDPCQTDMESIKGKGAYKDYNAHYIPVTSINPSDPYETVYYPTKKNEITHCDEFVVFHKSQTLPRFWVELEVELTYVSSDSPQSVNELIPHLTKLLQNPNVDGDQELRNYLCKELGILLSLEEDYLEERHKTMYEQLKQILDFQGNVNKQVSSALTRTSKVIPVTLSPSQPVRSSTSNNLSSPQSFYSNHSTSFESPTLLPSRLEVILPSKTIQSKVSPPVPSIAFGKADWEKYFGDIGIEPPLPENIEELLNEPCPFWPNKKVKETHLLVLIPNTVDGKPFTMNYLEEHIRKPKSGYATQYSYYDYSAKQVVGDKSYPSHWVLMTKDIIPGSRDKGKSNGCDMIANRNKETGLLYDLPHALEATTSILMHLVKTGYTLYGCRPSTYTYSQDICKSGYPLVVGNFADGGLSLSYLVCDCHIHAGVACLRRF